MGSTMVKKKSYKKEYIVIVILAIIIAGVLFYMNYRSGLNFNVSFSPDMTLADNALMGYAPDAKNQALCAESNLVFIELTWAEWEPEEGVYDIEGFEEKYNIARWKEEKKHAVLRFVCDVPGKTMHRDIPDWLYRKTSSGTAYYNSLGRGYSPDYSDAVFIKYHDKALKRLAQYCNQDYFVSFVELGSIGHNGTWTCEKNNGTSLMPDSSVCFDYATLYSDSFSNARLLCARNYDFAVDGQIGAYNDLLGNTTGTKEWLSALDKGGTQDTALTALKLKELSGYGKKTPVGGSFTADLTMDQLMGDKLGNVLSDVSASNMTYLGPDVPDYNSETYSLAADSVLKRMGYRIYVSRLKAQYEFSGNDINLEVSMRNAGSAGFFFDWPVTVYIYDGNKKLVFWEGLTLDLTKLSAGEDVTALSKIPYVSDIRDEFYIGIRISDYTGKETVELAIDTDEEKEYIDDVYLIYHYVRQ